MLFIYGALHDIDCEEGNYFELSIADHYKQKQTCDELINSIKKGIKNHFKVENEGDVLHYLQRKDPLLERSVKLANEQGYKLNEVNAGILATLILQNEQEYYFSLLIKEIRDVFEDSTIVAERIGTTIENKEA